MALKLLFFAQSANWMKNKTIEIPLKETAALSTVVETAPQLAPIWERRHFVRVAVNQEFADFKKEVHDGDEIAFFPPFSGG